MNLNNFTLKAQESVQQAFKIVDSKGQQAVECAHIIKGVMQLKNHKFLIWKNGC